MALDYYRLLGIPPDADQHRIRAVYRSLAKRFHPDTNHGSEAAAELFRQVNAAYRTLSDPQRRVRYDQDLARRNEGKPPAERAAAAASADPGQKFSRFVSSLLDAIFGHETSAAVSPPAPVARPVQRPKVKTPAFNFYYHVALEKDLPVYRCGRDGIYRKVPRKKPPA